MLLTHPEIVELVRWGVVTPSDLALVNGTSLDIRLGGTVLREESVATRVVDYRNRDKLNMREVQITESTPLCLRPGEFILAHSMEEFCLPLDVSAEYKLKSSMARTGLQHLNAGWCDPGWHGSRLTLELMNVTRRHSILLRPGDRIGQLVFFRHKPVPEEVSYRRTGRYNGDQKVSGVKP